MAIADEVQNHHAINVQLEIPLFKSLVEQELDAKRKAAVTAVIDSLNSMLIGDGLSVGATAVVASGAHLDFGVLLQLLLRMQLLAAVEVEARMSGQRR